MATTATSPRSPGPPEPRSAEPRSAELAPAEPGLAGRRRDRFVTWGVLAALAALTGLAWLALLPIGRGMMPAGMAGMAMAPPVVTVGDLALGFAMWAVMMPGMMLPSAAPMILTVARVHRSRPARFGMIRPAALADRIARRVGVAAARDTKTIPAARRPSDEAPIRAAGMSLPLAAFLAGYLLVWTGFSAVAALAQWGLAWAGLVAGMDGRVGPALGGALFVLGGIYQLSPLKHACLGSCRSPLGFLLAHWRDGTGGALRMGLRHGAVCLGCCWALMVLLFAVGTMNLAWVAGLGVLVLVEKLAPGGGWIARAGGVGLVAAGVALVALG